jgi:hypothetical protein
MSAEFWIDTLSCKWIDILKRDLEETEGKVWTGFNWLKIGANSELL